MKRQLNKIIRLLEEINSKLPYPQWVNVNFPLTYCGGCGYLVYDGRCYNCNPIGTVEGDFGYNGSPSSESCDHTG